MSDRAAAYPDKTWMIYVDENGNKHRMSYSAFIDYARRIASFMVQQGIRRGVRVAIADHNHSDVVAGYFACWLIGATAVPLNMNEDNVRVTYILRNSECMLILARTQYLQRIQDCVETLVKEYENVNINIVNVDTNHAESEFSRQVADCSAFPFPERDTDMLDDECLIVYTSGTTGNPKGVVLMQQNLLVDGLAIAAWHGITAETRMMCILPVHHVNGTVVTHVTPFIAGSSVVLSRKFSAGSFFSAVAEEHVNIVSVVPTILALLLESSHHRLKVSNQPLSHIICGAGPLTCELAERFESRFGIRIVHGYGLSETTCYSCFLPLDLSPEEHHRWMQDYGFPSIGVALPCNEMAIHDEQGHALGEGERGEIVVRGLNVMKGYFKNEQANADAFAHGWFHSGDEGFFRSDEKGRVFYFITGRLKELIIRGGVNIAPLEIDEVINKAPGVKAGICVGFEHTIYGEEVGALVVPIDSSADEKSILQFCSNHLPHFKAPKVVLFADELPVTSTGKYQRTRVRHLFNEFKGIQFRKV